jgi:hypothetical protein
LAELVQQGVLNIQVNKLQVTEAQQVESHLAAAVNDALPKLGKAALLRV